MSWDNTEAASPELFREVLRIRLGFILADSIGNTVCAMCASGARPGSIWMPWAGFVLGGFIRNGSAQDVLPELGLGMCR